MSLSSILCNANHLMQHMKKSNISHRQKFLKKIDNLNPKKLHGYDEISPKILKAIIHLTHIHNAILRTEYIPEQWKRAQVIMLLKPRKPPENFGSYRMMSLLQSLSKHLEKLLLKRIKPITEEKITNPTKRFRKLFWNAP